MKDRKGILTAIKNLGLVSQIAISMVTPIVLMILLASWIRSKTGAGEWIYILFAVLGVGGGASSVWTYMKKAIKVAEESEKEYIEKYR